MKILHINVRLNEGGAAKVALDLHRRSLDKQINSRFCYGYGPRAKISNDEKVVPFSFRAGYQPQVIGNFLLHNALGIDVLPPLATNGAKLIKEIDAADIVHLHVIHSYFLPYGWLFKRLLDMRKRVVITAHDHWSVTGRCAITDGCGAWRDGCGKCESRKNYPPSRFDHSASELTRKKEWFNRLGESMVIVTPSNHLAKDIRTVYPTLEVVVVPNGLDIETEAAIQATKKDGTLYNKKPNLLVIANDLSYEGKTNRRLVNSFVESGNCTIHTIGKKSPFMGDNVTNHGSIGSRDELISLCRSMDGMLFTSQVDSFGLVISEALACGLSVIATDSPASREVLGMVGLTTLESETDIALLAGDQVRLNDFIRTRKVTEEHASVAFSGNKTFESYFSVYNGIC